MLRKCPSREAYLAAVKLVARGYSMNVSGKKTGATVEEILSHYRRHRVVRERWKVWLALYSTGRYSLPGIGTVSGFDHTTILYGIRQARRFAKLSAPSQETNDETPTEVFK